MLSAASIAPAPIPNGTPNRQNHQILCAKEKPSKQTEVSAVLIAVTTPVPNLFIRRAENTLADTVPADIRIEITGNDLIKLGIPQGEIYKKIFDYIQNEKIKNNFDQKMPDVPKQTSEINIDPKTKVVKIHTFIPKAFDSDSWIAINPDGSGTSQNCWTKPTHHPKGMLSKAYKTALELANKNGGKITEEDAKEIKELCNKEITKKNEEPVAYEKMRPLNTTRA